MLFKYTSPSRLWFILCQSSRHSAPHCCHCLSLGARGLSGVPVVHGGVFVGRDQYMVPHFAPCRLQTSGRMSDNVARRRQCVVLCVVDCHPVLHLSGHFDCLFAIGRGTSPRHATSLALADGFHPCTLLFVRPQPQMVVRFVRTVGPEMVDQRQGRRCRHGVVRHFQWAVAPRPAHRTAPLSSQLTPLHPRAWWVPMGRPLYSQSQHAIPQASHTQHIEH